MTAATNSSVPSRCRRKQEPEPHHDEFLRALSQCTVFGGKVRKHAGLRQFGPSAVFQAVQARSLLGAACP